MRRDCGSGDRGRSERGFTFIEIIIALTLLAAATSILIGMQGAAVQRTIHDRNTQQAMLIARRVMATIEATEEKNDVAEVSDALIPDLFQQLGIPETLEADEKRVLEQFRATIKVEDWKLPLPNVDESSMQKMTLIIAWGPEVDERFQTVYFLAKPDAT